MSDTSCRLILIAPPDATPGGFESQLEKALTGGDCAALILPASGHSEAGLIELAKACIPIAQAKGCAVIIEGDARLAARTQADGLHLHKPKIEEEEVDLPDVDMICGAGGIKDRHTAMVMGTAGFDYIFFGDFNRDQSDAPHPQSLALASWWAEIFEIPAVLMGGNRIEEITTAVQNRIEFIALRDAIWLNKDGPSEAVRLANATIQDNIPQDEE